jgi:hypothetical protein
MVTGFSVTYERWDESASEIGETDDRGFVIENVSFTDAVRIGLEAREPSWCSLPEPSDSRIGDARWFTFGGYEQNWSDGIEEQRSLHIPDSVTPSSRRRLARLFGLRA